MQLDKLWASEPQMVLAYRWQDRHTSRVSINTGNELNWAPLTWTEFYTRNKVLNYVVHQVKVHACAKKTHNFPITSLIGEEPPNELHCSSVHENKYWLVTPSLHPIKIIKQLLYLQNHEENTIKEVNETVNS